MRSYRITDSITGHPITRLEDVQMLIFEPPGVWHQRQYAKEVGDGIYEVIQTFPHTGLFNVLIGVQSRGVRFADVPHTRVSVTDNAGDGGKKETPRPDGGNHE